ncbi:MAG: isoprenylcysteine carboxylmethyltransferase family protein [Gammaproteobacteria bacterium]
MANKKILPPTYLFISILLMATFHFFFPLVEVIAYPWVLIGCLPLFLGIALNLIADKAFKLCNTTVKPFQESTVLITTGVFGVTRHPMYLGMILILLGVAILTGSLTPFFVVPVFAIIMEKIFVNIEERMLAEKFGETWLEYKSKVRRWI